MNREEYEKALDEKLKQIPDSEYLKYLYDNKHRADLDSTICIQIPAYCDPLLLKTIEGCRLNAANPDRLHFAVCYQGDDLKEIHRLKKIPNLKFKHISQANARGSCFARNICNQMIEDEKYVLHLDAHMMFAKFWDISTISEWEDCKDPKAIITAYGHTVEPFNNKPLKDDKLIPKTINGYMLNASFFDNVTVKLRPRPNHAFNKTETKPQNGMFISGHYTFAKSELDKIIPCDPYMYFAGDETPMAVKYFTHGFNIYYPRFICIYHVYNRKERYKNSNIKFTDMPSTYELQNTETKRIEQLYNIENHGIDLQQYNLGSERTVEEFEKLAGVNFKNKTMTNFAYKGNFDTNTHTKEDLQEYPWWEDPNREYLKKIRQEQIRTKENKNKTILIMIPSYKDPHLLQTVEFFKNNADYPERIHFAICYQDDDLETLEKLKQIPNCKITHIMPDQAQGIGYAHHLLEKLLDDEDFIFQTDAHMCAVKGWDSFYIEEIQKLGKKTVISNYAHGFDYDNIPTEPKNYGLTIRLNGITDIYHLLIAYGHYMQNAPVKGYFTTACTIFGYSQVIKDCKHNPIFVRELDESMYTIMLYTHGYDIYHAHRQYIYHYYDNDRARIPEKISDDIKKYVEKFLGLRDDENIDLGEYAPGTERTVAAFEQCAGINFKKKLITKQAFLGNYQIYTYENNNNYINTQKIKKYMQDHNFNIWDLTQKDIEISKKSLDGIEYINE